MESAEEQYLVSAATCTAKAVYYKSCSVCGEAGKETFEYGDPLGHEYGEPAWTWNSYTSATATFTCTRNGCGDKQTVTASGSSITSVVTTPAECEKEGLKTYTAKVTFGGEEYTDTTAEKLEALGHTEGEAVRENEVPASCTVSGSYDEVVYCSVCGDELSREEKVIDALGHSFTKYVSDDNATCTEDGTETAKCDRCEVTDTRTDVDSALGHDWSDKWSTDDTAHWHECSRCDEINDKANHSGGAASCTKPAECEVCGVEYGEALGHTAGEAVRENEVPASCTEAGSYDEVVYCSVCEDELSREGKVIDALGHSFTNYISDNNATCTENGTETAKCDRCDVTDTRTDVDSALGHDWSDEWTTDGTSHWHECSRCDEINDKANHSGGAATCTKPAECEVCGAEYGEALGHTEGEAVRENEVPASCTEAGSYDEVVYCSVCGDELSREEKVIDALGHSFTKYVSDDNATCTEDGTETAKCDRCDVTDTRTDVDSALGHDWSDEWTTDGTSHWHECSRCDEINDKATHSGGIASCIKPAECDVCGIEYGDALGHDLEHHAAKDASCTEIGWAAYDTCTRCDYTTYVEIPAKGHTFGPDATCTEDQVCLECGEVISAASGHIPGPDATCTENQTCSVCGEILTPALGHSFTKYVSDKNATCTEDGTETSKCDRCEVTNTRTDDGSALGHDWSDEWTTDGTSHWHECSRCDEINDKANHSGGAATCIALAKCGICGVEYGDFAEHIYTEKVDEQYLVSAATCTASATYFKSCSVCGEAGEEIFEYGDSLGHEYGEPEWTWEGYTSAAATFTCTRGCGDKQTATASGSSITSVVTTPAECEKEGLKTYTAKVTFGGEEYTDTTTEKLEALGHTEGEAVRENEVPASCIVAGSYDEVVYCSVCGDELSREEKVIDALGHDLKHHEAKPATCTEIGWNAYDICTRCDYTTYVEIEALGHTEGEAVRENEVPASCIVAGSYDEVVYCSVCGDELSREEKTIPAKGHTFGPDATCTEDQICIVCGEIISAASGHIPGSEATCTSDQTCSVCGEILTPALGHDWSDKWTTDGTSHWHECSRCDEINDKANHSGGATTCTKPAECEVCGAEYGEALGHTKGEAVRENEVPASCTVAGSYDEVVYCSVCGDELSREEKVIDAFGHDLKHHEAKPATCTEIGWNAYDTCLRCDYTTYRELAAKGHTPGTSATCTEAQICTVCGTTLTAALGHEFKNGYCVRCGVPEDIAFENAKEDTKSDLDEISQEIKDKIDSSDLPDEVKEGLKVIIDKIISDAKNDVNGALDYDDLNDIIHDAEQKIEDAVQNAEQDDAKTELDEIAQNAKDEIDASDLPDDVKEDLKDKIDEIIGGAKDEVNGELTKEELDRVIEDTKNEIEDAVQNAEKDDAKSELDEIAQNAKEEIDASDLPDDVKEDLKDKIDEIIGGAKDEVNGELTKEELDQVIEDAKNEIEDAVQNAGKDDAKSELDEVAQNAKDEIDASDLPDDVKEDLKDKIDEIIGGAKDEVNGELTKEELDQVIEDTKNEIEDAVQNAEKDDAKTELDEIAQNAKDEVDASDLPDDVKEDLKDKIDEIIGGAKDEVDGSIDFDDVDQSVEDARQEIEDMILNAEKDEAKSDLDEIVQNAKDEIDSSELSDEGKTELKGKLDEILTSKKEEIGIAMTPEEIEEVLNSARDEIAALTGNLTEVQPDAIPLWPWLIAAGVISAALSAIFAWRHVKSVRAKGRTIGAKSIVTIAVATILIFVVVIGITFLIFAMI